MRQRKYIPFLCLLFRTFVYRIIDTLFLRKVTGLCETIAILEYFLVQLMIRPCTYSRFMSYYNDLLSDSVTHLKKTITSSR